MFRRTHSRWFHVVAQGNLPIQWAPRHARTQTPMDGAAAMGTPLDSSGTSWRTGMTGAVPAGKRSRHVAAAACKNRILRALGLAAEDLGPTHATFRPFFSNTILAHGFMFVTMSIGTTQFLQGFIASGNAVTLWLAKDIVPTLLSVAVVNRLVPERNAKRWFVVGYALTNVVTLLDFAAPSIVAAGWQPYAGVLSTMAKSMTHLLLTTCRATILEQLAHGNNFGTLMRAYTNAGTIAFAVCYGTGLMMAHCLSWHTQFVVMAACAAASMYFSTRAVRGFVPRKLTWDVARSCAWECVRNGGHCGAAMRGEMGRSGMETVTGGDGNGVPAGRRGSTTSSSWTKPSAVLDEMTSSYCAPSPEAYFSTDKAAASTAATILRRLAPIETKCNLAVLTSSAEHLESSFCHIPSLKLLVARGKDLQHVPPALQGSTFVVFESSAMVPHILGTLLLIEYAASMGATVADVIAKERQEQRQRGVESLIDEDGDDEVGGAGAKGGSGSHTTVGGGGGDDVFGASAPLRCRWYARGRLLEAQLHAAGWFVASSGALDDTTMRVTLS